MELTPVIPSGRQVIESYGARGFRVTGIAYEHADGGAAVVREAAVGPRDVVVGLSAGGRTRYTVAALEEAGRRGALTVAIVGTSGSELGARAERVIEIDTGAACRTYNVLLAEDRRVAAALLRP